MKHILAVLLIFIIAFMGTPFCTNAQENVLKFVNPFIGTDGHGHTFPGALAPFGMMQLSPDTRLDGWDGCSAYHFSDSIIYGFSHTHLSGTGVSDYGDVLLMPGSNLKECAQYVLASPFQKQNEYAEPGYYRVFLNKDSILAELTCGLRSGMHRYSFSKPGSAFITLDLQHRDPLLDASITLLNDREVLGYRRSRAWAEDQIIYFHIHFSNAIVSYTTGKERIDAPVFPVTLGENELIAALEFKLDESRQLIAKIGISAVDETGAVNNLYTELKDWDFDGLKENTQQKWQTELSKIELYDGREELKTIFYTALYHTMIHPSLYTDIDGRYRGADKKIHQSFNHTQYTIFSLWDTYRALHPLYNLIDRRRNREFVRSMLDIYAKGGLLPVWELAANETYCMIGYHSASVIADAWAKGVRDFDADYALRAMQHSANQDHFGLDVYRKLAHIPGDKEHESISKNLEYAYNDWCISQMAYGLGRQRVYEEFHQRAQYYKNIFDPQTRFMRPRINGAWKTPFDPSEVDFHFTEANSWQYSFYVPHDIKGLINLHRGEDNFERRLDELFETEMKLSGRHQVDITGLIGQYAHGNEPSHHMAYLYNYVGSPWKTQRRVRQILTEQYQAAPDGLSGNEDCGQMSAWYVLSALGFYPVCPGSTQYAIGAPLFQEAKINLENGRAIQIITHNQSFENKYIDKVLFNGRALDRSFLEHDELMPGAVIEFYLQKEPNTLWASAPEQRPQSGLNEPHIVPIPFFSHANKSFQDSFQLELGTVFGNSQVSYHTGDEKWQTYSKPITVKENTKFYARAHDRWGLSSATIYATYLPIRTLWQVHLKSKYNYQYSAGGPQGLVDGIRGETNWRLGGWQGYQGQDFEALIDLGSRQRIQKIGAGFCQDIRSWIWFPTEVEIWTSSNGRKFTRAATLRHEHSDSDFELRTLDLVAKVNTRARYIKVIARNYGTIPHWHLGAGGQAFIFIDEIWVE